MSGNLCHFDYLYPSLSEMEGDGQDFQTFFTPLFFFCNWLLHRWNGFYTWSQSNISLLSPLIISSKLTFSGWSGCLLKKIISAKAIVFKNTRRVVISVISQASAAGESNWRTIWCSAQLHQYCQAMPTCFCSFSFDISKYFCCLHTATISNLSTCHQKQKMSSSSCPTDFYGSEIL